MRKHNTHHIPVTLEALNQKLDFEVKRLVREKEEGIASYTSRTTVLKGISRLVFKKHNGAKIVLSYRLDTGGALRFAVEKQFVTTPLAHRELPTTYVGRTSQDIAS